MFGCLGRLGCLVLILLLAAGAWLTRGRWQPRLFSERGATTVTWQPVTDSGADGVAATVQRLSGRSGPAFVNLTAAEVASLIVSRAGGRFPASIDSVMAAVDGERVLLRASINLEQIRGLDALGPLGAFMNRRERLEIAGRLGVLRPGLAEYRVESVQIGVISVPKSAIPGLLGRLSNRPRQDGVVEEGLPFEIPAFVGDVRVARGRVTLYKAVQ